MPAPVVDGSHGDESTSFVSALLMAVAAYRVSELPALEGAVWVNQKYFAWIERAVAVLPCHSVVVLPLLLLLLLLPLLRLLLLAFVIYYYWMRHY